VGGLQSLFRGKEQCGFVVKAARFILSATSFFGFLFQEKKAEFRQAVQNLRVVTKRKKK